MERSETSGDGNPFTRFAFTSARHNSSANENIKGEASAEQHTNSSIKRPRSELEKQEKAFSSHRAKVVETKFTDVKQCSSITHDGKPDSRLQLLLKLYEARKDMVDTPIDKFGTHMCVASGVTCAKIERFQLLVAALLSSQTQDPITYAAMQRLHQLGEKDEGLTIETVRATSEEKLSEVLKPVGFYYRKAQQLKRIAVILQTQFHGDIPRSLHELLELPGIGPKIGRVITLLAWNQVDGIVVDTHVHRVAQRLGWASTLSREDTRRELEEWVPRVHWSSLSLAVVGFGQIMCTAKHPSCSACPLAVECPSAFKVAKNNRQSNKRHNT